MYFGTGRSHCLFIYFLHLFAIIYCDLLLYLGNEEVVVELLRNGTNVNAEAEDKSRALHFAAQYGKLFRFIQHRTLNVNENLLPRLNWNFFWHEFDINKFVPRIWLLPIAFLSRLEVYSFIVWFIDDSDNIFTYL